MNIYKTMTLVQAKELSLERIVQDYNVAIETIWHLQQQLLEEKQENAALWAAYEELSNKVIWLNYGKWDWHMPAP